MFDELQENTISGSVHHASLSRNGFPFDINECQASEICRKQRTHVKVKRTSFGKHLFSLVLVVRCWFFSLRTKYSLENIVWNASSSRHEENNMHSCLCVSLRTVVEPMFTMTCFVLDFYTTCVDIFLISQLTHPTTRRMRVKETIESLLLLSSETLHLSQSLPPASIWTYSIQYWKCFISSLCFHG
jgi:hypothetical protein